MQIARTLAAIIPAWLTVSLLPVAKAFVPPAPERLAAEWFSGFFDNRAQINQDPSVPFITMRNCLVTADSSSDSQYVHLEQYIGNASTLLRSSAYEFSAANAASSDVDLSVFPYLDRSAALGTCDQATPMLALSNLVPVSCDVPLDYKPEGAGSFVGTNAPTGCPTSFPIPGTTVVSSVSIAQGAIDSTDLFLLPTGGTIGTPVEFRQVRSASVPEPGSAIAIGVVSGVIALAHHHSRGQG